MATHKYDEHDPYNDGYHRGDRVVPFRVLSLGMSRTATASTQRALVMLGFSNCYHGYRPLRRQNVPLASSDIARWMRAFELKWGAHPASGPSSLKQVSRILQDVLRGRPISWINVRPGPSRGKALLRDRKFWDDLLGDCQSACDLPVIAFWREIWEAYSEDPEVKVVLNIRPIESWFKSVQVLGKIYEPSLSKKLLCLLDPLFCMQFEMGRRLAIHVFGYDANFKTLFRNDGSTEKVYERHNAEIRAIIPEDRLLLWAPQDGWQPLCAFLNRPLPAQDTPVPRVNDAAQTLQFAQDLTRAAIIRVLRRLLSFVLLASSLTLTTRLFKTSA